jgi:hypothetical protein
VVVEKLGYFQAVVWPRPVAKHYRDGAKHLHINMVVVALGNACLRIPAIGLYFTEELIVYHHSRAARLVMV